MTTNPWLGRRVINYAHQGGAREAPSSTLHAMRLAVANGATGLELDVHATADGVVVVCHDDTVDRTTAGAGALSSLTLAEVKELDNAYWWVPGEQVSHDAEEAAYELRGRAPADTSLCVATLREVLEEFPTTPLNLDIKQTAPAVAPYERPLAELLREYGRADDVIVASFWDAATDAFHEIAPEIGVSYGTSGTTAFWQAVQDGRRPPRTHHVALQVPPMFGDLVVVDERFVSVAHEEGVAVHVWTIDDASEMERLVGLDVDGIMSDYPSVCTKVLDSLGVAWRPDRSAAGGDRP